MWALCLAVGLLAMQVADGRNRGYSLAFQGGMPICGIRGGQVDWSDNGWTDIERNNAFTISAWVKLYEGEGSENLLTFNSADKGYMGIDFSQIVVDSGMRSLGFTNNGGDSEELLVQNRGEWNYVTVVFAQGKMSTYLNGTLAQIRFLGDFRLSKMTTFYFGSRLWTTAPFVEPIKLPMNIHADEIPSFRGLLDDVAIWSRDLSQIEIKTFMRKPITSVTSDLVVYYNFDIINCSTASLFDYLCPISGDGLVPNLGVSGHRYDLTLGHLNNMYGNGHHWFIESEKGLSECPEKFRFSLPSVSFDTPLVESVEPLANIPTPVRVWHNTSLVLPIEWPHENITIVSVPSSGTLKTGSSQTSLGTGDTVIGEDIVFFAPAWDNTSFMEPVVLKVNTSTTEVHEIHIWPFIKPDTVSELGFPGIISNQVDLHVYVDDTNIVNLQKYVTSTTAEPLLVRLIELPQSTELVQISYSQQLLADGSQVMNTKKHQIENMTFGGAHGMILGVTSKDQVAESFTVEFFSPQSGLKTQPLTINVNAMKTDSLPVCQNVGNLSIEEDDENGIEVQLMCTDEEQHHGSMHVITRLPFKGKLYRHVGNDLERIDTNYHPSNNGRTIEQYVHTVQKVSSYFQHPDEDVRNVFTNIICFHGHPVNIIGRPGCDTTKGLDCVNRESLTSAKDLSKLSLGFSAAVNVFQSGSPLQNNLAKPLFVQGKVVDFHDRLPVFQVFPFYRYDSGNRTQCMFKAIEGQEDVEETYIYPEHCTEPVNGPLLIVVNSTSGVQHCPTSNVWIPNTSMDAIALNDPHHKMLGGEYTFDGFGEPQQFIEITFGTLVYPTMLEVGSPFGGGTIRNIQAWNPSTTSWVSIYAGDVQVDKAARVAREQQHFIFDEPICQQNFMTNTLRLELDTTQKLIKAKSSISYVKLIGSTELQSAVLILGSDTVRYIPDLNEFGNDSFEYGMSDCGGVTARTSANTNLVSVYISPKNDPPQFVVDSSRYMLKCRTGKKSRIDIDIFVVDVDSETLALKIQSMQLKWGEVLHNGTIASAHSELNLTQVSSGKFRSKLTITAPLRCEGVEGQNIITLSVADPAGKTSTQVFTVGSIREQKYLPDYSLTVAGFVFLSLAVVNCILWGSVIWFRNNPVFRSAQVDFLGFILVGSFISSASITAQARHGPNDKDADFACIMTPWIYTLGFCIRHGSIHAKVVGPRSTGTDDTSQAKVPFVRFLKKIFQWWFFDFVLCTLWTGLAPLKYVRKTLERDAVNRDFVTKSIGVCTSETGWDFTVVLLVVVYHLTMLCYLLYICYSKQSIGMFDELKHLRATVMSAIQLLLFAVPLMYITSQTEETDTRIVVRSAVIWALQMSSLAFLFGPKLVLVCKHDSPKVAASSSVLAQLK